MSKVLFLLFSILTLFSNAQNNKQKTTLTKPISSSSSPINTNSIGSFMLNYEIKNTNEPTKTGKVFYAIDNNQILISPSAANLKDITNLRMLIDLKEQEMTMMTIDNKNKKSALLTKLPKPLLNSTTKTKTAPIITKTGIYKTIQGYKCEKTLINIGDSINVEAYFTTEIIIDNSKLITLSNTSLRNKSPFIHLDYNINGTMLESIITNKNGNITKLNVTDILKGKANPAAFNTDGYNIMDARGLPIFNNR